MTPLGKDRHGRLYWQLPHVTGVVVEGGGVGVAQWYHISTLETFQELMVRMYLCAVRVCVVHKGRGSAQCLSSLTV